MSFATISAPLVPTEHSVEVRSAVGLSRIVLALFISVVLTGAAAAQVTCPFNSPGGNITHVVYIHFDNVHLERDNPNVPSDLEQMPNLYNFMVSNGTLFSNHHTTLISHTADNILTTETGVYGDRHGQAVANGFVAENLSSNKYWDEFPSSFTYWTDPVETTSTEDTAYSMITAQGQNAPAPWVPFTRAGCNVGAVSIANMEMENTNGDVIEIYGKCQGGGTSCSSSNYTPQYKESTAQAALDFEGIAIHCATGSSLCTSSGTNPCSQTVSSGIMGYDGPCAEPDNLPEEPGTYSGYMGLFGHVYVAPAICPLCATVNGRPTVNDLNGNAMTGFPGFSNISAAQTLGYVAQMLENGVPVVFSYISDLHDCHSALPTCTLTDTYFRALGPGEAPYETQIQAYNQAFGEFFTRLQNDGIDSSNTLFIITADEQDHFVGGPASPAGCDGVTTPCNYVYPAGYTPAGNDSPAGYNFSVGEVQGDLTQLYEQQFPNLVPTPPAGDDTPASYGGDSCGADSGLNNAGSPTSTCPSGTIPVGVFDYHYDMAPAVSFNPYLASNTPSFIRQMERATAQLTGLNPITGNTDQLTKYLVDSAGLNALHMITADPKRTPNFVMFANPNWYFQEQAQTITQEQDYAYNHGGVAPEINTTWLGLVGPGVANNGVDSTTWTDHVDTRATLLYLTGLTDDYQGDGRVLVEDLVPSALPSNIQSNLPAFEQLAAAYKQMNAPIGSFGQAALQGSTTALASGSPSNDVLYTTYESNLNQLTSQRNALATQIKTQLYGAEYQGATLNPTTVASLTTQANDVTANAQLLVSNLNATPLAPGSIQVSRIQYDGVNSNLGNGDTYTSPYSFPEVFNDQAGLNSPNGIQNIAGVQGSIFIDQFNAVPGSSAAGTLALPSTGVSATYPTQEPGSYITSSFSSKSEGSLMFSPGGNYLTYFGYEGNDTLVDVSNSYSPNPLYELSPNTYTDSQGNPYPFYDREVAMIGAGGLVSLTPIDNADSGDNPRAAITVDGNEFYTAGNSDSTEKPVTVSGTTFNEPGLTIGVRCGTPSFLNGAANPDSNLSYQLGTYLASDRPDESTKQHVKDNNWRGIGIYNDVNGNPQLYVSKGSGGNGDDGVFLVQVNGGLPPCNTTTTGTEPTGAAAATFTPVFSAPVTNQTTGAATPYLPFGFWFANPTTLYVADEGNPGSYTGGSSVSFSNATNGTYVPSNDPYAGLEKWSLVNGVWTLDYTIQAGLNFNQPQTFTGYNDINGNPLQSYTYGLRNMTGVNNGDGSVTIFAITSQFSAVSGGEPDPTSLVGITDSLAATALPANEQFVTLQTSANQEVFRGVAYIPPAQGFTRQSQTVTFTSASTAIYGAAPITLTATSTSGWPVAYSLTSGPATLSGNVLTITGVGQVVVQATQSGNTAYAPASNSQTIIVSPASLTVTASNASSTYGGAIPAFSATITGFVNGDTSSVVSGAPMLSTTATSASAVGAYPITAAVGTLSAANYTFSTFLPGTLTINPAPLLVTPNNATTTYGTIPSFTAAITGFVNGDNSSVVSGAPTLTTTATTTSPVGTYPINASLGTLTAANYKFTFGTGTLTIKQASQTISFSMKAPATAAYATSFTVVANSTSMLPVTYSSAGSCSNVLGVYTITSGSGTCTITASEAASLNFLAASPVSETTTAERATPTVALAGAPTDAPYNSSFVLTATTNSSATAFITATDPTVCQVSGMYSPVTVNILKGAGACKFTASWGADANYTPATATASTTAIKATPIITWATPASISYGTPLSSTQLDASANVPGTITYTPAAGAIKTVGSNSLKATFVPSVPADYIDATATVTLQVTPASTTTSITSSSATVTLNVDGVAGATLDFNVTSYRPTGAVTLTASTGESCSGPVNDLTGNGMCRLTFTTAGTRTITASYSGDNNHTGSTSEQSPAITVTVNPY